MRSAGLPLMLFALLTAGGAARAADLRGQTLYEARCGACHSIDVNRTGPLHRNVFGRVAGTAAGFAYSTALRRSGIRWTAANLDRWLQNPEALVPGQAMDVTVPAKADRDLLIDYLRGVSTPRQ